MPSSVWSHLCVWGTYNMWGPALTPCANALPATARVPEPWRTCLPPLSPGRRLLRSAQGPTRGPIRLSLPHAARARRAMDDLTLSTAPTSKRFPTTNQAKACYMCAHPPAGRRPHTLYGMSVAGHVKASTCPPLST